MRDNPIVSVVIGTYNRLEFLQHTITTVREELNATEHEILVIDGGSTDGTTGWLTDQKDIILIIQHNRGEWNGKQIERKSWGYFMNLGFRAASGKYICMLSDDCLVVPGAVKNGIKLFEQGLKSGDKIGAIAFHWRNWPEQEKYWIGQTWGNRMFVNHGLYLREALEQIHFIDDSNYIFYHADGDLCLRLWEEGYKTIASPDSYIEHFSEANLPVRSTNLEKQRNDWATYSKKWGHLGEPKPAWLEKSYKERHHIAEKYWKDTGS